MAITTWTPTMVQALREAAGMTQKEFAKKLGFSVATVCGWEQGRRAVKGDSAAALKTALKWLDDETVVQFRSMVELVAPDNANPSWSQMGLTWAPSIPDTVDVIAELGRSDMERRQVLIGAMFSVAASIAPSRDWLVATLDEVTNAQGVVGSSQVAAIQRTFGIFQELDVMRGGGHARAQLATYLNEIVVPLLRTNDPETEGGRQLFSAGSEQLYLLGWMAFDNGEHSIAQRYLIQALHLADTAYNVELGAHILAGLSDQATLTGHPDHGVQLARTGAAGLQRGHSLACLADLRVLQARAEAAMGDPRAAHTVARSQEAFANAVASEEPEWARFIDSAYLNGEYAHVFRDLQQAEPAAAHARISAEEAARQKRARRGCLANAALARAALDDHDLETATTAGQTAMELATTVKSSRSTDAVNDLRQRLTGHAGSLKVQEFLDRSAALMPALARC